MMLITRKQNYDIVEDKIFPFKYKPYILRIEVYNDYSINFQLVDPYYNQKSRLLGICIYAKLITKKNVHNLSKTLKKELELTPNSRSSHIIAEFYNMAYKIYKSIFFKRKEE